MQNIIERFYKAFAVLDVETMLACYHPDIVFSDPAFGILRGDKAKNMWKMLCQLQKNKNFIINWSEIEHEENYGSARWEAFYTFRNTGRKIHNVVFASFKFKDGLIIKHTDEFDLHRWAKQALGFRGFLIGKTTFFRNKLQAKTNYLLHQFEKKQKSENAP